MNVQWTNKLDNNLIEDNLFYAALVFEEMDFTFIDMEHGCA